MPTLKIGDVTNTSIEARITDLSTSWGRKYITWYLDGEPYGWDETVAEDDSTSDWIVFDRLDVNTEYIISAVISYDYALDDRLERTVETVYRPDLSYIEIVERDSGNPATEITVRAEGLDEDYEGTWTFDWFIYDENGDKINSKQNYCAGGSSNSPTVTFSGLEPGTEYYIDVNVYYDVGDEPEDEWIDGIYCTTADEDEGYYQPSYDDINVDVSATDSSITVCVTGFDEDYDGVWSLQYLVIEKSTGAYAANITLRSDSDVNFNEVTFDSWYGITSGTTYQILLILTPYPGVDSGVSLWVTWEPYEVTTGGGENFNEDNAKLNLSSSTDGKTITAYVSGLNDSYPRDDRSIVWSLDGDPKSDAMPIGAHDSTSDTVTWTGLTPGATYRVGAVVWFTSNGEQLTKDLYRNFETNSPQRPAKFKWADGSTKKYSGDPFDIKAGEWCELLDNINAVRKYKGKSEFKQDSYTLSDYYNYFTYPVSGQTFRYQHYNQALNAITGMLGTGYNDNAVKKGDPVTAAKINLLVEWLNGIT